MSQNERKEVIPDKRAFYSFLLLGLGNLLPFFAFITATNFYKDRLCSTSFVDTFTTYFNFAYNLTAVLGLLYSLIYAPKHISLLNQVRIPIIVSSILLLVSTLILSFDVAPYVLFYATLAILLIVGFTNALMNGGLFAIAGMNQKAYTSALMLGAGMSGTVVSLLSFSREVYSITTSSCDGGDDYDDKSTSSCPDFSFDAANTLFFSIATLLILLCLYCFEKLPALLASASEVVVEPLANPILNNTNSIKYEQSDIGFNENKIVSSSADLSFNEKRFDTVNSNTSSSRKSNLSLALTKQVFKEIIVPSYSVFISFTFSLCIFPSVIVLIQPYEGSNNCIFSRIWVGLLFILWNIADFSGRLLANQFNLKEYLTIHNLHKYATARGIFLIMFLFCKITGKNLPNVFISDAFPIIFILLFSGSGGYLANIGMMLGPMSVQPVVGDDLLTTDKQAIAGVIMILSLTLGLLAGSALSFLFVYGSLDNL